MDLTPFDRINPCGLTDIGVTHIADFATVALPETEEALLSALETQFEITCADRAGLKRR